MSANGRVRSSTERGTGLVRRKNVYGSRAGSSAILSDALRPSISRQQHILLSKEQAAARYPVTLDLAGSHPSVNGANLHPTQLRDFAFGQKLFTRTALVRHTASPPVDL
jgi:hypothetical protein